MLPVFSAGNKKLSFSMAKMVPLTLFSGSCSVQHSSSCCNNIKQLTPVAGVCAPMQFSACDAKDDGSHASKPGNLLKSARFRWKVTGMDCGSCARKVENIVRKMPGVRQVQVIFSTQKLLVDGSGDLREQIEQALQAAGYQLQDETVDVNAQVPGDGWRNYALPGILAVMVGISWGLMQISENTGRVAFILSTLIGLYPVALKALRLTRSGNGFAIESLMTIAAIGALVIGATAEAAMVLLLFLVGEKLERWAASRARRGVSALIALKPETATRLIREEREQVPVAVLNVGDIIEVAAGGKLPADGKLLSASASFDESMLTGESLPVERQQGERIAAGVTSVDKQVRFEVVSQPGDNAIDRIIRMIEEAQERRAPIERFIDHFSRIYTPMMMLLALLLAVGMPLLTGGGWNQWIYKALALLLIGCPCALVISTPAAITSGLAAAARIGALVKGGAALEQLSQIQQLAFDKTGTLTAGEPQLCQVQTNNLIAKHELLTLAAAVEQGSSHPLALAIIKHATEHGLVLPEVQEQRTLVGRGIEARLKGHLIRLIAPGNLPAHTLSEIWLQHIDRLEQAGQTVITVSRDDTFLGIIGLRDTIREDAIQALSQLGKLHVQTVMLTGDNPRTAAVVAAELGIRFHAGLLPQDKVSLVQHLSASAPLAMVGDGINDAPAMKTATIGIAMGNASDVALETADVALTRNQLNTLPALIALARATRRNVRQNIAIALGLKGVFLLTTILGLSGLWLAVLADTGATVLVTVNALRLLAKGQRQSES